MKLDSNNSWPKYIAKDWNRSGDDVLRDDYIDDCGGGVPSYNALMRENDKLTGWCEEMHSELTALRKQLDATQTKFEKTAELRSKAKMVIDAAELADRIRADADKLRLLIRKYGEIEKNLDDAVEQVLSRAKRFESVIDGEMRMLQVCSDGPVSEELK